MRNVLSGIFRQSCRNYASKRTMRRQQEREDTVHQLVSPQTRRTQRLYGMGFVSTGSLGVEHYMLPKTEKSIQILHHPVRLQYFPLKQLQVRSVGCGYGFTVFICKSLKGGWQLYGTGLNSDSQLGFQEKGIQGEIDDGRYIELLATPCVIPTPFSLSETNTPSDVSCGRAHTVLRTVDGSLFSFGNNVFGQCGREVIAGEVYRNSSIVSRIHIDFHKTDDYVEKVVCGQDHTLFLTNSGHVYSCGLGSDGQLGLGHFENVWQPTRVKGDIEDKIVTDIASRGDTVLATCRDGQIYGWGNSEYAQLSDTEIQLPEPRRLFPEVSVGQVVRVAAAGSSCAVLNTNGDVFVWGYGLLGHGPQVSILSKPKKLPGPLFGVNEMDPDARVVSIASGLHHFVALNSRGTLFSWGSNRSGCLGLGQFEDQTFPLRVSVPAEVTSVECGVDHMIILSKAFA